MNTRLQYTMVKPSPALGHKYIPNNKGSSPEQAVANQKAIGSTETWCQWQQQGQRTPPRLIFCCFCLLEYFILKRRRHPYKPLYNCILLPHCLPPLCYLYLSSAHCYPIFSPLSMRVILMGSVVWTLLQLGTSLFLGAFNIKSFGDKKASNSTLMDIISTVH